MPEDKSEYWPTPRRKASEFTSKQMEMIYAFIDEYVREDRRSEAMKVLKSLFRRDREIMKQRLSAIWNRFLSELDNFSNKSAF